MTQETISVILFCLLVVHDILLGRTFIYQRTIRELALQNWIDPSAMTFAYPKWMMVVCKTSMFQRWIALLVLFFLDWRLGVAFLIEFIISFKIQMTITIDHKKNLRKLVKRLRSEHCDIPKELKTFLLEKIESTIDKTQAKDRPPTLFDGTDLLK